MNDWSVKIEQYSPRTARLVFTPGEVDVGPTFAVRQAHFTTSIVEIGDKLRRPQVRLGNLVARATQGKAKYQQEDELWRQIETLVRGYFSR